MVPCSMKKRHTTYGAHAKVGQSYSRCEKRDTAEVIISSAFGRTGVWLCVKAL